MNPEFQCTKKHQDETSSMLEKFPMKVYAAEVLRQVEGAVVVEGGRVAGNAWFGIIVSCVETMKRFKVRSTFVVKNNTGFSPLMVLHKILQVRFKTRPS